MLSKTDMYYTCVMYCHEKHRVRLYRKTISAVASPGLPIRRTTQASIVIGLQFGQSEFGS